MKNAKKKKIKTTKVKKVVVKLLVKNKKYIHTVSKAKNVKKVKRKYNRIVKKESYEQKLDRLFTKNAKKIGVPKYLIKSICKVESGLWSTSFSKK